MAPLSSSQQPPATRASHTSTQSLFPEFLATSFFGHASKSAQYRLLPHQAVTLIPPLGAAPDPDLRSVPPHLPHHKKAHVLLFACAPFRLWPLDVVAAGTSFCCRLGTRSLLHGQCPRRVCRLCDPSTSFRSARRSSRCVCALAVVSGGLLFPLGQGTSTVRIFACCCHQP